MQDPFQNVRDNEEEINYSLPILKRDPRELDV